ncbi:MAG: methyltransferase domain-containing protein [Eubacteriaceae bacterium]|nr:methyltransferase domain-containing protein [Eubacteriaceae bacterium]
MKNKVMKFESPQRLAELDPKETLLKLGFSPGMVLCDIGAGSGIFSFPAAEISSNNIYAIEISEGMIEILNERIAERKVSNIIVKKADGNKLPVKDISCDMAIMVTVLHEIDDKEALLVEIQRLLVEKGTFAVVEFHKKPTPSGPPKEHRISEEEVKALCKDRFEWTDRFDLGENFYCLVFKNQ